MNEALERITLNHIEGSRAGQADIFNQPVIVVGRAPDCHLQYTNERGVSSHHAEIRCAGGKFTLVDNNSTNGSFVNEERVTEQLLKSGDSVRFGFMGPVVQLEFAESAAAPQAGAAPPSSDAVGTVFLSARDLTTAQAAAASAPIPAPPAPKPVPAPPPPRPAPPPMAAPPLPAAASQRPAIPEYQPNFDAEPTPTPPPPRPARAPVAPPPVRAAVPAPAPKPARVAALNPNPDASKPAPSTGKYAVIALIVAVVIAAVMAGVVALFVRH